MKLSPSWYARLALLSAILAFVLVDLSQEKANQFLSGVFVGFTFMFLSYWWDSRKLQVIK